MNNPHIKQQGRSGITKIIPPYTGCMFVEAGVVSFGGRKDWLFPFAGMIVVAI